jgi:hypothetical protein
MLLLILVMLLLVDVAEDGFLGKVKFCLPTPAAKTAFTASHSHPDSGLAQTDFQHEVTSPNTLGSASHDESCRVSLQVPPTLQIMHCCHLSSSGGMSL